MMQDPIISPTVVQPKIWNHKLIYPHYRLASKQSHDFPREFYKWWKLYYATTPTLLAHNVRIRLGADNNRTLESFFIHKKPSRDILTKMITIYLELTKSS